MSTCSINVQDDEVVVTGLREDGRFVASDLTQKLVRDRRSTFLTLFVIILFVIIIFYVLLSHFRMLQYTCCFSDRGDLGLPKWCADWAQSVHGVMDEMGL